MEIHKGKDGRYYCLDTARLFPPLKPVVSKPGSHLYRLFRPEFVQTYSKPLSSDAYSSFGSHNKQEHNIEASLAYNYLVKKVGRYIPLVYVCNLLYKTENTRVCKEAGRTVQA